MNRLLLVLMMVTMTSSIYAQGRGGDRGAPLAPPPAAKAAAPFDMTGYWVSIVSEDWRWRMFPNKGDYAGVPLNPEGRRVADAWDPAKDQAAGEQCKGYGAPPIMRIPGRFHITWQDDQTLKIEADAGTQTRLLQFGNPQNPGEDWQGVSKAEWQFVNAGGRGNAAARQPGSLKVVTTRLKPGYLRRNGVPYSANGTLTEYYDVVTEPDGDTYLVLTSKLEDPAYLTDAMITAAHFKKQAGAAGWNPSPCAVR
ncbi:MAG TPA: hypothetical protein VER98_03315 [Terriglobia bacterium]|nr:hypothetical protein [Terriglobia bacterium]